jgi:hypothetical protein
VDVLPERSQTDVVDQLNADMARLDGVLLIVCGDERTFPQPNGYLIPIWALGAARHARRRRSVLSGPPGGVHQVADHCGLRLFLAGRLGRGVRVPRPHPRKARWPVSRVITTRSLLRARVNS